ncbi:hypothetical protein KR009_002179 [Drosophila setifemur]|nr:hypothetical protein KR009_002179 [Drosophila setifemur]
MKLCFLIILILGIYSICISARCPRKCPETEKVVWALSNGCHAYRNECYFKKANCGRKKPMIITTRKICQTQCPDACPFLYKPIMGNYKGQVRFFDNDCYKTVYTCLTGESK